MVEESLSNDRGVGVEADGNSECGSLAQGYVEETIFRVDVGERAEPRGERLFLFSAQGDRSFEGELDEIGISVRRVVDGQVLVELFVGGVGRIVGDDRELSENCGDPVLEPEDFLRVPVSDGDSLISRDGKNLVKDLSVVINDLHGESPRARGTFSLRLWERGRR